MTIRNRELSQFGSFIYIDNNTKDIGITTEATPYVGVGTTNATSKFHVVGETKLEGDLNVSGVSTFASDLDINASIDVDGHTELDDLNVTGVSTFLGEILTTSNIIAAGDIVVGTNFEVLGISTFYSDVNITDNFYVSGIGTIETLGVTTGTIDYLMGTNVSYSGIGTIETLDVTTGTIDYLSNTNLNISGIATINQLHISGLSTFASDVDINASVDISSNLNVTGLSTFASDVDINASVDIFNNLGVSGLSTFSSDLDINASVDISDNLSVSGITTLASSGGITTTGGDLYVGGDLYISDDIVFDELNARNINVTGVSTLGIATINELYVSGVSTFGNVYVGSAVTISANEGTVGATTFYGNFVGSVDGTINGNAGTATSLETARDFSITGDFVTASTISFDGTDNVAFAATITPNSIGLGTYTSGDYVKSVSGTSNEIVIIGGTGESSTPTIGISSSLVLPGNLLVNGITTFIGFTSFSNQLNFQNVSAGIVTANEFYLGGSLLVDAALEVWQPVTGDDIYRRLGHVGIGTSTNLYKLSVNGQIESQAEQGTAPFVVRSTTNVPNLNADTVDGRHAPSGDIVGTSDSQTLTNKSINLANNTLTGTVAQFNTALSDDDFATLNNAVTLTNKTLTSPSIGIITNTGGTSQAIPTGIGTLVSTSSVGVITTGMIAASAVSNSQLVNSTISGVSLGGNLFNHSPGSYITGNAYNGSSAETWGVNATSANTADTIVARDSSGHFSAGDITAQNVTVSAGGTFFGDGSGLTDITADFAVKVSAADTSTAGPFYLTFVDSNNTPAEYETLYTDGGITYDALNVRLGIGSAVPTSTLSVEGDINVSGIVTALAYYGDGSNLTSTGSTVTDDIFTNEDFYPLFTQITSGIVTASKISTSKLSFNPSTGILSATAYYGDGFNLSGVGITVFNDTTTDQEYYPLFTDITSGKIASPGISTSKLTYNPSSGEMTAVNFNSTSDENLKTNIQTVENALNIVDQLRGVSFDWKESGKSSYGVIAQELEDILPELVNGTDQKSVNYNGIIGILIEAIKELKEEIEELKTPK